MIDLFWVRNSAYNVLMKIFFILSSMSILYFVKHPYKASRDVPLDTFKIEYLLLVSVFVSLIFNYQLSVAEVLACPFVFLTFLGFMVVHDLAREPRHLASTPYHPENQRSRKYYNTLSGSASRSLPRTIYPQLDLSIRLRAFLGSDCHDRRSHSSLSLNMGPPPCPT